MTSSGGEASSTPAAGRGRSAGSSARSIDPPLVLFVGRSNASRSIMAEGILTHLAQGRLRAASAGAARHRPGSAYSNARLVCPRAGAPLLRRSHRARSGTERVARTDQRTRPTTCYVGSDIDIRVAFEETFGTLKTLIQMFLALPFGQLTDRALLQELSRIGELGKRT